MKKIFFLIAMFFALTLSAQVKVGDNPTSVHSSAMLQVDSSTKGFLPPRMTNQQMTAIASPANGLMVYCTDCSPAGLYTYSGSAWSAVGNTSGGGSSSSGGVSASMAFTTGTWIWGGPTVTRNIVISITNNSFSAVSWVNANTNLALSGGNTGLTVGTPTAAGGSSTGTTTTLASGVSGTITFPVTGIVGTMDEITATWTKLALTVVGTQAITPGSATFTNASNNAFVFSANASGLNVAGTLPNGTTVALPYTSGVGKYEAYTSPDTPIASTHCNDGASDWTFAYSYPTGTFATSGNLTATLITKKAGVITAWPAKQVTDIASIINDATWSPIVVNGNNLGSSFTVGIDYGGDAIRGQLSTSAAAYDAAAVGAWVPVTNAEYDLLSVNVPGAVSSGSGGLATSHMNSTSVTTPSNAYTNITVGMSTVYTTLPTNRYICGVRFKTFSAAGSFLNTRLKIINTPSTNGYVDLYGAFPAHTSPMSSYAFYSFVVKRPTVMSTAQSSIAVYVSTWNVAYLAIPSASPMASTTGNQSNLSAYTANYAPMFTLLTTSTKSW